MSKKVNDFFETFRVDFEGIDLGANSDKLPPTLVIAIEEWIRLWDPRNLNHVARIWFKEPVCEHCQSIRKETTDYMDAVSFIARHPAVVATLRLRFGALFSGTDVHGQVAMIRSWEFNLRRSTLKMWNPICFDWEPLL